MCGDVGTCVDFGCTCPDTAGGDFCTVDDAGSQSAGIRAVSLDFSLVAATVVVLTVLANAWSTHEQL